MDRKLATLCAIGATFLFGFIGVFNRGLNASGLTSTQISFLRMTVTALSVGLVLLLFSRSSFRIKIKDLWIFALIGAFKVGADIFFLYSQVLVPLSLATVLQNLAPYFVLAISFFMFKEKISSRKIIAVVIGTIGCVLIIGLFNSATTANINGILYGLGSAVCISVYYLCGKALAEKEYSAGSVMFYGFAIGALLLVFFADVPVITTTLSNDVTLVMDALLLGVICTALPYYLTQLSYSGLEVSVVSVLGLCEVLFSAIIGFIFFNEAVTVNMAIGMILVCLSVLILEGALFSRNPQNKDG